MDAQYNQQQIEDSYHKYNKEKSVIIIGAGPCGILSIKYLKDYYNLICIESRNDIGGQWLFESTNEFNHPNITKNAYYQSNGCLFSSLYENLKTNLPKFLMSFKGFPPKEEYDEFMTSQQFFQYLQDYSTFHHLKEKILFNTFVSSVRLTNNLSKDHLKQINMEIAKKFLVEIRSSNDFTKDIRYLQADSVIVATGHYSVPNYPKIQNMQIFKGFSTHMHYFREEMKQKFIKKHLVVYGCGLSAQDIILILLKQTPDEQKPAKITVIGNQAAISNLSKSTSYKEELNSKFLEIKYPYIKVFDTERSLVLESGERIEEVDCILFATGYKYTFPFLDNKVDNLIEVINKDERHNCFGPLYKRMFSIREPNLIFLGTSKNILSIQLYFERQVICVKKYLNGEIQLPSQHEMEEEFNKELDKVQNQYNDLKEFFRMTSLSSLNEVSSVKELSELVKIPVDEDFQNKLCSIVWPIYQQIYQNGNYALWKFYKFSDKIPSNYTSDPDLF